MIPVFLLLLLLKIMRLKNIVPRLLLWRSLPELRQSDTSSDVLRLGLLTHRVCLYLSNIRAPMVVQCISTTSLINPPGFKKLITSAQMCFGPPISKSQAQKREWRREGWGCWGWQFWFLPRRHCTSIHHTKKPVRSLDKTPDSAWRTRHVSRTERELCSSIQLFGPQGKSFILSTKVLK